MYYISCECDKTVHGLWLFKAGWGFSIVDDSEYMDDDKRNTSYKTHSQNKIRFIYPDFLSLYKQDHFVLSLDIRYS